ncbi:unnamed protein product [Didymodactylos carnosus]|uniref:VWFA domain-containing protein n=1 Tax=Didymodactylos carnosus TaxID=1234261 RepID=A0A815I1T2_9BILA|nr:unnamed protein product [Didymodactylos carnosus]CAF4237211.1 unnamed protein product [Didymodactylos carnosus]
MYFLGAQFVTILTIIHGLNGENTTCDLALDLILILDSSGSISVPEFAHAKYAMVDLVERLNINEKGAHVAVVNYATTVDLWAAFDVYNYDKISLVERIKDLEKLDTGTATGDALYVARHHCEGVCRRPEQAVTRAFIVFTDGNSNSGRLVVDEAPLLPGPAMANVFAVGIGDTITNAELIAIASDKDYTLRLSNYIELTTAINNLTIATCHFPAFIMPNIKILNHQVGQNLYHYYQMNTQMIPNKNGMFIDLIVNNTVGRTQAYTSLTSKNPKGLNTRQASTPLKDRTYTQYIPVGTNRFYFSLFGMEPVNQYHFVAQLRFL